MKSLLHYLLSLLLIFGLSSFSVNATENEEIIKNHEMIVANKYAERFCSAKSDNFFEGLENEKTLKYSYFKYIGLQSEEVLSNEVYKSFIHQIRENCKITNEEEREIKEFILKNRIR
tara:strand:- start:23 stop:373 length:351 start_codon:yes stop_codon:yes gene_type:complete